MRDRGREDRVLLSLLRSLELALEIVIKFIKHQYNACIPAYLKKRENHVKSKGFDSPGPPYVEFPSTSVGVQYMKGLQKQIQKDM